MHRFNWDTAKPIAAFLSNLLGGFHEYVHFLGTASIIYSMSFQLPTPSIFIIIIIFYFILINHGTSNN